MTLWILFGGMSLVAIAFAVLPLYRRQQRVSPLIVGIIAAVVALSSGLYYRQGQPEAGSAAESGESMESVIASLVDRLEQTPGDTAGWKMLGRSYLATGNFDGAIDAFEKANSLEGGGNAQTLVSLGEARLVAGGNNFTVEISALFESALALDPNSPQALFYSGLGAFNRDDQLLAADRWERLLSLNPPPEIEGVLRQRIAEWRGEAPPVAAVGRNDPAPRAEAPEGTVVEAIVSLSEAARSALGGNPSVFIIARDPGQPSPPIAVVRRSLSDLPAVVYLSDAESMVAGRDLSAFAEFELIARVSVSGQPGAQSGDWFGSVAVRPEVSSNVALTISQQVP